MRVVKLGAIAIAAIAPFPSLSAQNSSPAPALRPAPFDLTIDNIMRGPELYGTAPSRVRFSDDSRYVYFRWRRPGVDTAETSYRVSVAGGEPERLASPADSAYPQPGEWSRDRRTKVFLFRGDVYLWDAARGVRRQLTDTPGAESSVQLSGDARTVYFVRDNNLYAISLDGGPLRQLTDVRRGPAPAQSGRDTTGQRGFLRAQQRRLFDFIQRPPRTDTDPFAARADSDTTRPRPFYLSEGRNIQAWDVSPDGRYLLITESDGAKAAQVQTLPIWVTATGYLETRPNRTKVGDEQTRTRAAIMELATGAVNWVDPGLGARVANLGGVGWSAGSHHALVRGQSADFSDRWLWVVDVPGFAVRQVDSLHDSAWVGQLSRTAGWLPDGETVYFSSEASGWAHLYTVPASGGSPRALTSGRWEVRDVDLSPDGRRFYFHSGEAHWGEHHAYTMGTDGSGRTQLTRGEGRHDVVVSPDDRWLAILYSTANHPPELYVQPNRPGALWRRVTESTTEEFRRYAWRLPELVMVPARDGAEVPARLYRPTGTPNGAGVIFVHGAGYLQNAHKWWSSYSREYMFHHFLAEHGYTVLDMDYRASAGHGRDWRAAIFRHMGGPDLDDNVDGARWMVRALGVDSARIGIYGGSYGGFITLMAMFTAPGVFRAGAALRPVTDWAHYNHGYTAAILNEPQEDSIAYIQSSPIYHAEGLRGALLICHGMVDDNVNFQDAVRLVQRLIELRKENWEVAIYPVEPHGFRMASSWADEYKRIYRLFGTNLAPQGVNAGGANH
ncbi:MAG: prolyl oligopeptidase family serine peptidase [Gemmatimonadetes bacterium]|nr:prolyl oligopeptidase family serine peptidase [Gemmatimonadota bacterium]